MKQVNKEHYEFENYSDPERWMSYYNQIIETLAFNPQSVLEIGIGGGIYRDFISQHTNIDYKSLDIAEDLSPDILGSVDNIPFEDGAVDLVVAFEILEHLPFERFERSLFEINRICRKGAVISLPHFGPPVKFLLKVPFLKEIKIHFKIPYPRPHKFNGEHYWEIGKIEYSQDKIRKIISKYFIIKKEFVPFENQYHHFFILTKREIIN